MWTQKTIQKKYLEFQICVILLTYYPYKDSQIWCPFL